MTGRRGGLAGRLVRLYPRDFRTRHAAELSATLDDLRRDGRGRLRASVYADLLRGAAGEWLRLLLGVRPATILSVLIAAPLSRAKRPGAAPGPVPRSGGCCPARPSCASSPMA